MIQFSKQAPSPSYILFKLHLTSVTYGTCHIIVGVLMACVMLLNPAKHAMYIGPILTEVYRYSSEERFERGYFHQKTKKSEREQ